MSSSNYKTLGSFAPAGVGQKSFLLAREQFDSNRQTWIRAGKPRYVQLGIGREPIFEHNKSDLPSIDHSNDTVWNFEILSKEDEISFWKHKITASSFALLAEPFVDTDMPADLYMCDQVLLLRGYSKIVQKILRLMLLTGLFWNLILWGDWCGLSFGDFVLGWGTNLLLLSIPLGLIFGWTALAITLALGVGLCVLSVLIFRIGRK